MMRTSPARPLSGSSHSLFRRLRTAFGSSAARLWTGLAAVLLLIVACGVAWGRVAHGAHAQPSASEPPADDATGFMVQVDDHVVPHEIFSVFVMPGEALPLDVLLPGTPSTFRARASKGVLRTQDGAAWTWTAPDAPGVYTLSITDTRDRDTLTLNAFVLHPFSHEQTHLNGYRIGRYKQGLYRNNPNYERPTGFIAVPDSARDIRVSPHFRLEQFLCKQASGSADPHVLLRERLLLKLEHILRAVQDAGYSAETLHVMSGFRTPYYNRSIGNRTSYSRHLYGDAADIFVDADGNGRMDDLDGDGRITRADAVVLAHLIGDLTDEPWYEPLVGGLGIYGPAPHRGPFVHVDTRGTKARW